MKVCVVSSGSKGNMTYIETEKTRILIDCGISYKNATSRCGIDFSKVTDILITHEHSDHVAFLKTFLKKSNANLYIHKNTFLALKEELREEISDMNIGFIEKDSCYHIGDCNCYTLELSHDCSNIFGYIIECGDKKFGCFTDTGFFPLQYKSLLSDLDCLLIEANHNIEMLMDSNRDYFLINRILSTEGHMSNKACYDLLNEVLNGKTKNVILGHISEDCNNLSCLEDEIISKLSNRTNFLVSSQYEALKVIEI